MIRLAYSSIDIHTLAQQWNLDHVGMNILRSMSEGEKLYDYEYVEQLHFEIVLRANIVKAAYELYLANPGFALLPKSQCNPDYWDRTRNGGFLLKYGVLIMNNYVI